MRDSEPKRAKILSAAAALFVERGFDGTTFQKVSKESGLAIGSIIHFFGDKAGLAAAVYDDVMRELAADADAALRGHAAVEAALRAVISACLDWDRKFPNHRRLVGMLGPYVMHSSRGQSAEQPEDLPKVLAGWADRFPSKNGVTRLSPDQLYAVILAPAMCARRPLDASQSKIGSPPIDWLSVLTNAALSALAPPTITSRLPKARSARQPSRQGWLAYD